jgi:hypothetical protein
MKIVLNIWLQVSVRWSVILQLIIEGLIWEFTTYLAVPRNTFVVEPKTDHHHYRHRCRRHTSTATTNISTFNSIVR